MKLALFDDYVPGLVVDDDIIDVSEAAGADVMALPARERMTALIAKIADRSAAFTAESAKGARRALSEARLRAPLPRPGKILVALNNYTEGVEGPVPPVNLYMKAPSSILDPGGQVELPEAAAVVFHHEAQVAAVIGKGGKDIARETALDHVFGYTGILNVNARGLGFGLGIDTDSFDTFTPMGPWIVSSDELPDPQEMSVTLKVGTQTREVYSIAQMRHRFADLIAFASGLAALEPGDLILSGACYQGVGPLQNGDAACLEISRLGRLTAVVHDPLRRRWPNDIDRKLVKAVQEARRSMTPIPFKTDSVRQLD